MKFNYFPPKASLFGILLLLTTTLSTNAQVGINTTTPDANAMLDVVSSNKGALLPRINLTSTTAFAPLSQHVEGMLVYNLATVNNVTPGYYYNDGTQWIRMSGGGTGDDWKTTGNAGTTAGTNFLGTTDPQDLQIRSNNAERMRFLSNGQVSVNDPTPIAGDRFSVTGANGEYAVNGYTTTGTGVYGQNSSGLGYGVFGASTNIGNGGYGAYGGIFESGLNAGYGAIAINTTTSGANRTGLLAVGQNLGLISFPGTAALFYGQSGGASFTSSSTGVGFMAVGNAGMTAYYPGGGAGFAGTGTITGVYGISTATSGARQGGYFTMNKSGNVIENPPADDDPFAILAGFNGTEYFGGYFDGSQVNTGNPTDPEDFAYVGINSIGTSYKILGTGTVSTLIKDKDNQNRVLFAPEAPEILFEDYGVGQLINGYAHIHIDPLFASAIHVSEEYPLKVFIQLEGDCNGVYVTDKSNNGFTVRELQNGQSNVQFSWHIVANRADRINSGGQVLSKHVGVRFPVGPKKIIRQETLGNNARIIDGQIDQNKLKLNTSTFEPLKSGQ